MVDLEKIKNNFESKGERVPLDVEKKITAETAYNDELNKNNEKSQLEVQEIEKNRANAPKDSKGNPILVDENEPKIKGVQPIK